MCDTGYTPSAPGGVTAAAHELRMRSDPCRDGRMSAVEMTFFPESRSASADGTLPVPHRLFPWSYDSARPRLDDDSAAVRGSLLRAAAVAELRTAGLVRDGAGRAEWTGASSGAPLDPFLAGVLGDVAQGRPRSWFGDFTFLDDLPTAIARARATAGDRTVVLVGGTRGRTGRGHPTGSRAGAARRRRAPVRQPARPAGGPVPDHPGRAPQNASAPKPESSS